MAKQTKQTSRSRHGKLNVCIDLPVRASKEASWMKKQAKLQRLQDVLQSVNGKIAAEKKKVEDEARARRLRMEQEARNRAMEEMRERMAKAQKERAERVAKEAREAQAAQEHAWMVAAAERRSREVEERAQAIRRAEETARKAKKHGTIGLNRQQRVLADTIGSGRKWREGSSVVTVTLFRDALHSSIPAAGW